MLQLASKFSFGKGSNKARIAIITFAADYDIDYEWKHPQSHNRIDAVIRGLTYQCQCHHCRSNYQCRYTFIDSYARKPVVLP